MTFENFKHFERNVQNIETYLDQIAQIDTSNHVVLENIASSLYSIASSLKLIAEAYTAPYDTEDEDENLDEDCFVGLTD